jgi:hypothetical protein
MSSMPEQIHLHPHAVWILSAGVTGFVGLLFCSVAFAAGVRAFDTLAILFAIAAAGTQLALIVLYLINQKTQ